MFYETWAGVEETSTMKHSMDGLAAIRDQYAGFLPHIKSRAELKCF